MACFGTWGAQVMTTHDEIQKNSEQNLDQLSPNNSSNNNINNML